MQKAIALSFLLIANIILLAHAVVPHHDHENMRICFFDSHCKDCNGTHHDADCETPAQNHQDNACSNKCCNIDNVFDSNTDGKVRIICHKQAQCDYRHTLYMLISNASNIQKFNNDALLLCLYKPYVVISLTDYVSQSKGLRAPPTC